MRKLRKEKVKKEITQIFLIRSFFSLLSAGLFLLFESGGQFFIIANIIVIVIITITMYGIDQSIDHLIYEAPTNKHTPNHTLVQSL